MDKILSLLPLLALALPFSAPKDQYKNVVQTCSTSNSRGNYTFTKLVDYEQSEFRIYRYDDYLVDEIADEAFKDNNTVNTLVISNCVTHMTDAVLDNAPNIKTIKYTGSKEEFVTLGLKEEYNNSVIEYAVDEGFINYWNKEIRPDKDINICNIGEEKYNKVYKLYRQLFDDDLASVNEYVDVSDAKIKDTMKTLVEYYDQGSSAKKTEEWNQTGAITLIIFIAIIGMTSITIFFLLKTRNIIQ